MSNLAANIDSQPQSLAGALQYHMGAGGTSIKEAARLLRSAKKIVLTAMGASLFASIPLQYFLSAQGLDAVAIEAGELLHYRHEGLKDAVFLVVSRSGESVEIARLLERLKGRVQVIGVTNEPDSLLARSADVALSLASLPDQIVAIQTYTATLLGGAVADSLAAAAAHVEQLLLLFGSLVGTSMREIEEWSKFLKPDAPIYLLARGPSLASAYEGALLFHEIAKCPAVAMPIASFRHGPVEVVDPNFRGIVFAPQDGARDLNLALARDLVEFGGQVRLIGPQSSGRSSQAIAPWSDVPDVPDSAATLAPIFEVVPLQAAAYQMAVLRGVEPGSFRFAPQVSVDEASFNRDGGSK